MRRSMLLGLLILALAPAVCAEVKVDESLVARLDGKVEIDIGQGSVKVIGWDQAKISVEGTLGDRVERLKFRRGGRKVWVKARAPKEGKAREAHLILHIPRNSSLDVEAVQGPISVSGATGGLDLATLSGDISVIGPCRDVEASTVNGSIILEAPQGKVIARTVGGAIVVKKAGGKGPIDLRTISGAITVSGKSFTSVALETVSGSIRFEGGLEPGGKLSIDTHSGEIVGILPADLSAEFDIRSFAGSVENAFNPELLRQSTDGPGANQEFIIGDGDMQAEINIDTFKGRIRLVKQKKAPAAAQTPRR